MSHFNTLKTTIGYLLTLVERQLPLSLHRKELAAIFNYVPIDDRVATSGQPTEPQFTAIKHSGYEVIINLAPHGVENSLKDEASTVTSLGMQYVHIPVDFKNPTNADFDKFCAAMKTGEGRRVLVHCAANMRASAFAYRYRCQVSGDDPALAKRDLYRIWMPTGVWKRFIESTVTAPPAKRP
jgi:protein tyrosine phosphatase (PTP) superfamily phosphohydrolase (DUF442 family)